MKVFNFINNRQNKKRISVLTALIIFNLPFLTYSVNAEPLWDIKNHWAERELDQLMALGIVKGFEDGSFKPQDNITRAQFVKMLICALGYEQDAEVLKGVQTKFKDVAADHWAGGYIAAAWELEIAKGDKEGNFFPDEKITRAEITAMVIRTLKFENEALNIKKNNLEFKDSKEIPEWAVGYIDIATRIGIISGMPDNSFSPNEYATRAQGGIIIQRMLMKLHGLFHYKGKIEKVDQRNKSITLKINDTKTQFRISDDICIYMNKEKTNIQSLNSKSDVFIILNNKGEIRYMDCYK
ncbi:MAG TPA: S-layer homology domain-containing protein [Thermoanaerobacterales bacterium]|nr:S-layer homology domain-containing protein [Thermoanaerobacterales bacterium]